MPGLRAVVGPDPVAGAAQQGPAPRRHVTGPRPGGAVQNPEKVQTVNVKNRALSHSIPNVVQIFFLQSCDGMAAYGMPYW